MPEVSASVAIVETPGAPAPATGGDAKGFSFVDSEGSDPAAAILDEVLGGEAPADDGETPAETPAPAKTETPPPAAEPPEAARLRSGFAKLADERQKLIELQNTARAERQSAQQFAEKASKHDALVARLREDPAGVIAELGDEAVNKTLQGFIDREKSPVEREVAALKKEREQDKQAALQREQEAVAKQWREDIAAKVQADERFDLVNTLGLHNDVIDVIAGYYEKHSERDDKGNVVVPAILSWDLAAQAVEDHRAGLIEKSKRYGKRAPAAPPSAQPAKTPTAPVKRAPTSLSSVPVAEAPHREEDLSIDPDERERQVLASLGY